jgi:hypothetical protein
MIVSEIMFLLKRRRGNLLHLRLNCGKTNVNLNTVNASEYPILLSKLDIVPVLNVQKVQIEVQNKK